jgi:hypothetical protein
VEETLGNVKDQVQVACRGVAAPVQAKQKETGVKDSYTQSWIDHLIDLSRERQKNGKGKQLVESELMRWVNDHSSAVYNPFLTLKCKWALLDK